VFIWGLAIGRFNKVVLEIQATLHLIRLILVGRSNWVLFRSHFEFLVMHEWVLFSFARCMCMLTF